MELDNKDTKNGALRVWWNPQIGLPVPFYRAVDSLEQAQFLITTLAFYDIFQYDQNIKSDYANAGGLEVFEGGEWVEWVDPKTSDDINDYIEAHRNKIDN